MALQLIEGFDTFTAANQVGPGRKFRVINSLGGSYVHAIEPGRFGGKAYRINGSSFAQSMLALGFETPALLASTVFAGFAVKLPSFAGNAEVLAGFASSGYQQICVSVNSAGFVVIKEADGTLLATSETTFLNPGVWYYMELQAVANGSSGLFVVYINGAVACTYTGNTLTGVSPGAYNELILGSTESGTEPHIAVFDDIYVCDSAGVAPNTRLGDSRVEILAPTADSLLEFDIIGPELTGSLSVDEIGPDGDFTAISSSTPGDRALFTTTQTLSEEPRLIHGISVTHQSRKDGADTRSLKTIVKVGASETVITGRALLDAYTTDEGLFPLNPDGSVAWTRAAVEGLIFGVEVL